MHCVNVYRKARESLYEALKGCQGTSYARSRERYQWTIGTVQHMALQSLQSPTSTRRSKPPVAQPQPLLPNKPPHHAQDVPVGHALNAEHEPHLTRKKPCIAHFFAVQKTNGRAAGRSSDEPSQSQRMQSSNSEDHADQSFDHKKADVLPSTPLHHPSLTSSTHGSRSCPLVSLTATDEVVNEVTADMMEIDEQSPSAAAFGSSDSTHSLHARASGRSIHVARSSNANKGKAAASKSPGQCTCEASAVFAPTNAHAEEIRYWRTYLASKLHKIFETEDQQPNAQHLRPLLEGVNGLWNASKALVAQNFEEEFETYAIILNRWIECVDTFVQFSEMTGFEGDKSMRESSVGKKLPAQWYMMRLGLPLTEESKGSAGRPKFQKGSRVMDDLYDATHEEVDKVACCYSDTDQLRVAVTPVTMELVQAHTGHIFWKFGSAI
jgi:hypothetical protein